LDIRYLSHGKVEVPKHCTINKTRAKIRFHEDMIAAVCKYCMEIASSYFYLAMLFLFLLLMGTSGATDSLHRK
jgi:hypothetical protein